MIQTTLKYQNFQNLISTALNFWIEVNFQSENNGQIKFRKNDTLPQHCPSYKPETMANTLP